MRHHRLAGPVPREGTGRYAGHGTTVLGYVTRVGLSLLIGLAACKSGEATGPGPTPTALRIDGGNQQTGVVGAALPTPLSVLVLDKDNKPVVNRRVDWDVGPGSGTVSPVNATTDAKGIARTTWTLGSTAGTVRVSAQVNGVSPAPFTATALPGAPAAVTASPETAFLGVGDTLRIRAAVRDQFGNDIGGQAITFSSQTPTLASVTSSGLVTALAQGQARIVAEAGGRADTVPVGIGPAGSGACGPITPRTLALGEVVSPTPGSSSITTCLAAPAGASADYALTLISTATSFGTATTVDLLGIGNAAPQGAALMDANPFTPQVELAAPFGAPVVDVPDALEQARRLAERRELTPLVDDARDWMAARASVRDPFTTFASVTELKVGDAIRLNVNASVGCSNADMRNGRVAAVGTRAVIVTDNDNPTGGYTDSEYSGILATFDTLVYPMDTAAFGAPSNISPYGKIVLFYTRAVNQLTPASAGFTIGGFFFARDLFPKTARNGLQACAASNETEMFYLLVPDPNGTVNGNKRTKEEVTQLNLNTIAHELQHLINAGRRLYVNTGAQPFEQTWLDEGLSHVAEELLYWRVLGFTSRQNLGLTDISGTTAKSDAFRAYGSQNFSRFYSFITAPEVNSPYAPNDSLATRGAIWHFLRYAAGRQGAANESVMLRALVNSLSIGTTNLQGVLPGGQFADYLRDWTIAMIADDYSTATAAALAPAYQIPAWNLRSIYPGLRFGGGAALGVYPIATRSVASGVPQRIALAGGTSSFLRFGIPAGRSALFTLTTNGALPPATLRYAIVRLR